MRLRSVFKMRTSILNTATTEQMGYGIFSFFWLSKSTICENGELNTNLFEGLKKRKAEIWYKRKCEDSRFVKNACSAFLLAPTSLFLLYQIFAFLFFGSRWKLVFKSWMGIRGLPRSLWFLIRGLFIHKKITVTANAFYLIRFLSL